MLYANKKQLDHYQTTCAWPTHRATTTICLDLAIKQQSCQNNYVFKYY